MSSEKGVNTAMTAFDIASIFQNLNNTRPQDASLSHGNQDTTATTAPNNNTGLPPEYSDVPDLSAIAPSSSSSQLSDDDDDEHLPEYEAKPGVGAASTSTAAPAIPGLLTPTAPGFFPTKRFQVETVGHPLIALPFMPKPVPILVYNVSGTGAREDLAYTSLRDARTSSNSSVLVRADDSVPVCVTAYRFGPGRAPKIQFLSSPPSSSSSSGVDSSSSTNTIVTSDDVARVLAADPPPHIEPIHVVSDGCHTRSQTLRTGLGTLRWRYGTRTERRAAGDASSLLILEHIVTVGTGGGWRRGGDQQQQRRRRRVAQLIRCDATRTEGSTRHTAGNGGRLEVDLGEWLREGAKGESDEMEKIVVASCLVMLKKEVDRRRLHQAVVLMAGAS